MPNQSQKDECFFEQKSPIQVRRCTLSENRRCTQNKYDEYHYNKYSLQELNIFQKFSFSEFQEVKGGKARKG